MKNQRQNIQRQIADLIPIIEHCLPLIERAEQMQEKLKSLPTDLEQIKKFTYFLKLETYQQSKNSTENSSFISTETTEYKLDSLVDDLEEILTYLASIEYQINNVLALKERLEATQEERIDGITPERIYKLLEKQRATVEETTNHQSSIKANRLQKTWQKIVNYRPTRKLTTVTAVTSGIILSFSLFYYSAIEPQSIKSDVNQKNEQLNN